ncbi:MAG: hypothetical protein IMZ46_02330 [Acidobacteria bacterium]|nr:hypothetical protein [Acidobacteriota bacterium]
MKISKLTLWKAALYVVFIVLFWFLGPTEKMGKATAFFGVAGLSILYELGFWFVTKKILGGSTKAV